MKKILIFSTAYFPHIGGAEVAVKEITDCLGNGEFSARGGPALGWDMITVKLDKKDNRHEKIGKIDVYRLGWGLGKIDKLLFPFRAAWLGQKLHQKNKYDVVWSIMASFSGFAALFFKKRNPKVKFLLTLQEGDDLNEVEKKVNFSVIKKWFREIFQKADYIQSISNYLADWAKTKNVKCPVVVVPNGVDVENFRLPIADFQIEEFKDKLNIKEDEKVIITVSRLVKKNGVEDLIKAMKDIEAKLIICGTGEDETKLKSLVKNLEIKDRVLFLGNIDHKKIPQYLWLSDVFCRPSLSEGLGNVFLEAMVAGLPVVATSVGGIPDFLKDGKTGWFCQVKNPKSIAEKIEYILDEKNKEEVDKVVQNARQLIKEKYNWALITKKMKNIFESL